jgi:hypothetical protein
MKIVHLNGTKPNPERINAGTAGSYFESIKFYFTEEWKNLNKKAVFYPSRGKPVEVSILEANDNIAKIPAEVMQYSGNGEAKFVVSGYETKNGVIDEKIISLPVLIDIDATLRDEGVNAVPPTPNMYEQLEDRVASVEGEINKVDEHLGNLSAIVLENRKNLEDTKAEVFEDIEQLEDRVAGVEEEDEKLGNNLNELAEIVISNRKDFDKFSDEANSKLDGVYEDISEIGDALNFHNEKIVENIKDIEQLEEKIEDLQNGGTNASIYIGAEPPTDGSNVWIDTDKNGGGEGSSGGGSVQADLAQNDTTAPDYVKGRTHWSENKTLIYDKATDQRIQLFIGRQYVVVYGDNEYICECKWNSAYDDGKGSHYLGNPYGVGGFDDGLPFTVVREYTGIIRVVYGVDALESLWEIKVNKIPEEYLPTGIPHVRYKDTIIVDNETITTSNLMGNGTPIAVLPAFTSNPLTVGRSYTLIWNGVEYTCDSYDAGGEAAIGNRRIQMSNGYNSGEPCLISFMNGMFGIVATSFTTATISIIEHTPCYNKLGEEYYNNVLFVDIQEDGGVYTTSIKPEVLLNALSQNIPICAKIKGTLSIDFMWLVSAVPYGDYGIWYFRGFNVGANASCVILEKDEAKEAYKVTYSVE